MLLLKMIEKYIPLLLSCISDEGSALIPALVENNIPYLTCLYHVKLKAKLEDRHILNCLGLASSPDEYAMIKNEIYSKHKALAELLDVKSGGKTRWERLSIYEDPIPRDYHAASVLAEAYNSTFQRNMTMKWEPLPIFCKVHSQILGVLENIAGQQPDQDGLTESAHVFDAQCIKCASKITVAHSPDCSSEYICTNQQDSCKIHYDPKTKGNIPKCSCMQYENGGFPCPHMIAFAQFHQLDYHKWIHPRFFVQNYRELLGNIDIVDFPTVFVTCRQDKPSIIKPLGRKQSRRKSKGELSLSKRRRKSFLISPNRLIHHTKQ